MTVLAGVGTYSVTEYRGKPTDAERARIYPAQLEDTVIESARRKHREQDE